MFSMHQNQNLFLRTVFKYSFLFVPSSVIAAVCFILSQREVKSANRARIVIFKPRL